MSISIAKSYIPYYNNLIVSTKASQLNKGQIVKYNRRFLKITDIYSITPGRRKAIVQITTYDVESGTKMEIRTGVDDDFDVIHVIRRAYSYSYEDTNSFYFINLESFDEIAIEKQKLTEKEKILLIPQMEVMILLDNDNKCLTIELPIKWTYIVKDAGHYNKNSAVANDKKVVMLDNGKDGFEIRVPGYVNIDDEIVVNTETMEFVERANKK